jgi:mono/diheme cytochrome c family protein
MRTDARQERDAGGYRAPTAALERGRAVYVLNHCHFCHGADLTRATMGAANLSQSVLVGADVDGNAIGPIVKAGLPNLQTAMPSYRDLTVDEIVDLARYVHFLRQQARFRELSRVVETPAGNAAAGEAYFNGAANCRSCHSVTGDLAGIGRKHDAATLRARLLRPGPAMPAEGVTVSAGHAAHLRLLENYTLANVQDLVAYLSALR